MESDNKMNNILQLTSMLQRPDKQARIKALELLRVEMCDPNLNLRSYFDQTYIPVLKCFKDPSENCREIAITIMEELLIKLDKNDYYLTYIFPTLTSRLGDIVIVEESEEIRLQIVKLLRKIIELYQEMMVPFFDQCSQILTKTVLDPFAKVKHESCVCISELTKAIPKHFHMQSESYLKAVIQVLKHQHFRIRIIAIQCVSDIVEHTSGQIMDDVFVLLSCAMNDLVPNVRLAVIRTAHAWLLRQPGRYSYFVKMLPLILLGLTDEVETNVEEANKLWKEIGLQYAQENEKDLKDKLDYLDEVEPSRNLNRHSLGCRMLVIRNTMQLLSGICNELTGWRVEIRRMAARLLNTVVVHNEEDITQHLQKLLPEMAHASKDEDDQVLKYIKTSAEIVGQYVTPKVYCAILLPGIEGQTGSTVGQLCILALLIKGSKRDDLNEKLSEICQVLLSKDICQTRNYSKEVLNCCQEIITVSQNSCSKIEYELFVTLITIMSLNEETTKSQQLLLELSQILEYQSIDELYKTNSPALLSSLTPAAKTWTVVTPERCIFETLIQSKPNFREHFPIILKILEDCLNSNPDSEARLKIFITLSKVMIDIDDVTMDFKKLVNEILTPNLVWHAGRLNESLRSAVILCLCACLPICVKDVPVTLVNTLLGLLEERSPATRINVLKAIGFIAEAHPNQIPSDAINKVYPELLKRLDDAVDLVRIETAITLGLVWKSLDVKTYKSETTHSSHLDYLYSTLLIHLDDQNEVFQKEVLEVLKCVGKLNVKELKDKLEKAKNKFRNKDICETLIQELVIK